MNAQNRFLTLLAILSLEFLPLFALFPLAPSPSASEATVLTNEIVRNEDDLMAALTSAHSGETIYVSDMKVTKGLHFDDAGVKQIKATLASPDDSLVTLDVSAVRYPNFAFNFSGPETVELSFRHVALDGKGTGTALRFRKLGGTMGLTGADIRNCHSDSNGGALRVEEGEARLLGCSFEGNSSLGFGGAISCKGDLDLSDTVIQDNTALMGGGVYAESETAILEHCELSGNYSTIDDLKADEWDGGGVISGGGGIYARNANLNVSNSILTQNRSSQHGGGICNASGETFVYASLIGENQAARDGGGIWTSDLGLLSTRQVDFRGNQAASYYEWNLDGGEYAQIHHANILNTTFTVPFTNAFNNVDVNFTGEATLEPSEPQPTPTGEAGGATPQPESQASPQPSPTLGAGASSPTPEAQNGSPPPPSNDGESLVPNEDGSYDLVDEDGDELGIWRQNAGGHWVYHGRRDPVPWYYSFLLGLLAGVIAYLLVLLCKKRSLTRGDFVDLLVEATPLEDPTQEGSGYEDVPASSTHFHTVRKAGSAGLLTVFSGHKFHPLVTVTREEAAGVLASLIRRRKPIVRVEDLNLENRFRDYGEMNQRFYEDVKLVCHYNLMTDTADDHFEPQDPLTRAKMKKIIQRLKNVLDIGKP